MISSSHVNYFIKILPEETRLIYQAKSGDTIAFVKLYDMCVERVYRYVYFLVPNTKAAEVLTFRVFFRAWEQLDRYQIIGSSFIVWLYSVARSQVISYLHTYKKTGPPDNDYTLAVRGGDFMEEFQVIRDGLKLLTLEQQQVLILKFMVGLSNKSIGRVIERGSADVRVLQTYSLQVLAEYLKKTELKFDMKGFQWALEVSLIRVSNGAYTVDECLARYPEYAAQLKPLLEIVLLLNLGRNIGPLPAFKIYTQEALVQYMWSHPRRQQTITPILRRTAMSFAMLAGVLLVTGTAQAQSALPGDAFYPLKRASEQAWRAISPDPVSTDIILAERRLNEWVAVASDPTRNANAKVDYLEVLARLETRNDGGTFTKIVPALKNQQQTLTDAGLLTTELDDYLVEVLIRATPTAIIPTVTITTAPTFTATASATFTQVVPTATATEVVPTATASATFTQVVPTATATEVVPTTTPTVTPTEVVPTETAVPTEVVPTETEIPTEVVPTETEVPAEILPTAVQTEEFP